MVETMLKPQNWSVFLLWFWNYPAFLCAITNKTSICLLNYWTFSVKPMPGANNGLAARESISEGQKDGRPVGCWPSSIRSAIAGTQFWGALIKSGLTFTIGQVWGIGGILE